MGWGGQMEGMGLGLTIFNVIIRTISLISNRVFSKN